jgi:hypothetical protein
MRTRLPAVLIALLATMSLAASAALATDTAAPVDLAPAPPDSSIQTTLNKCTDTTKPSSSITAAAARKAVKSRTLKGTAKDTGCGVAMVTIAISRIHGKRCQAVTSAGHLGHAAACGHNKWLVAKGTKTFQVSLKGLPKGTYRIQTRAVDFAGNIQKVGKRVQKLKLR